MSGPPSSHSRCPGDKGSWRWSLAGQAQSKSRVTRPACGRGWRMEASMTQGRSSMINRMMGTDGGATKATLGTSLLLPY